MRKFLITFFAICLSSVISNAQMAYETYPVPNKTAHSYKEKSEKVQWRKGYVNLGFCNSTLKQSDFQDLKSYCGFSFSVGTTFYLHQPIAEMLRFGLDASWLDIDYENYRIQHLTNFVTEEYMYHQGEVAMRLGPSVTIKPAERCDIHGYFQFCPTFAAWYDDNTESFFGNYASLWAFGGSVSFGAVGLGVEGRLGNIDYRPIESSDSEDINAAKRQLRLFVTFKF